MSAGRLWAIVIVALLHALIGYAFVTGLATTVLEKVQEDLKTFDVEEPPPPEEEPPPPPPDQPQPTTPPPVTAPPMQRLQTNNPIRAQDVREDITFTKEAPKDDRPAESGPPPTRTCPDGSVIPATSACPPPPKADPPRQPPRAATLRSGSISDDDYPASALRAEAQGTTTARFTIGTDGRVTSCSVTGSSGNSALDQTTCRLIQQRFRFRPAVGADGNPTTETRSQRIVWRLPEE
jgi:protein TonB